MSVFNLIGFLNNALIKADTFTVKVRNVIAIILNLDDRINVSYKKT